MDFLLALVAFGFYYVVILDPEVCPMSEFNLDTQVDRLSNITFLYEIDDLENKLADVSEGIYEGGEKIAKDAAK